MMTTWIISGSRTAAEEERSGVRGKRIMSVRHAVVANAPGFLESEMHTRGNDIAHWRILLTLYPIERARTRYM